MRSIIAAIRAFIASMGRWIMKVGKSGIEWVHERGPAIVDGIGETVTAVVAAPGRLLDRILPSRGATITPPTEGAAAAPQEQRNRAAERAHQEAQDVDLALSVRSAARALLRGQEPTVALPAPIDAWLRHVGESAWVYLAALKPEQIGPILQGRGTAHVPAFEADAWVKAVPAVRPVVAPVAVPQTTPTLEQVRATINGTLSAGARDRIAARWGLNDRKDDEEPAPMRAAAGMRP